MTSTARHDQQEITAVAYVRVSTEEQAQEGVSLDAQEDAVRSYCQMRGMKLVEVVTDAGVSAGKPLAARDGGRRVLDLVRRREVQSVVAWKLDRVFRDTADCLTVTSDWDRRGVAVHLVDLGGQAIDTSSAMGRFFLTIMAGVGEMERNLIRERVAAAMKFKASRGEFTGGEHAPYGFAVGDDGVHLAPLADEQAVIEAAKKLRTASKSLRAVAQELEHLGFCSRSGRPFQAEQIRRLLRRAA